MKIDKSLLYITYNAPVTRAPALNSHRRIVAMEKAGFHVTHFTSSGNISADIASIFPSLGTFHTVLIRIDGSCLLDAYTILKFLRPGICILWEIHGFPEENCTNTSSIAFRIHTAYLNAKRTMFSRLVDGGIYVSSELQKYSEQKCAIQKSIVLPNFVTEEEIQSVVSLQKRPKPKQHVYTVFWGGNASLHWQAVDLIFSVAQHMLLTDPTIRFVLTGDTFWHIGQVPTNCILTGQLDRIAYLEQIINSDICLALYHKPKAIPFYFFPLKILEYMTVSKPIIASKYSTIESILMHGKNGLLTDNSIEEIVRLILLLKNSPGLRKKLTTNAFKTIRSKYTMKEVIPIIQKFLSSF